jgi:hypothetical protein
MQKIIRRRMKKRDCTPTLVNLASDRHEDGWCVLPAWEVEAYAGTRAYFVWGDWYPVWTEQEKRR